MTIRSLFPALACISFLLMTGCSSLFGPEGYFRDRGDDYLQADVIPPIDVPEGMDHRRIDQLYVIPSDEQVDLNVADAFEVPRPQPLSVNAFTDRVKIQKLGEKRWILVSASPSEVWPKLRYFLGRNNLQVVYTDAINGIIETSWLQFKGDETHKDKFRVRIEQGVQPGNTEIHLLHLSVDKSLAIGEQTNWPENSVNSEREAWLLDELAAALAADSSGESTSLLAQTIGVNDKVKLTKKGEEPILQLTLETSRAWATVGHAVQQQGFTLWELDETLGVFYVQFDEKELLKEEPGFWSRLFSRGKKGPPVTPYKLSEVLAHLQLTNSVEDRELFADVHVGSGEALKKVPGFLIVLRGADGDMSVRIRDGYGRTLSVKEAKKMLDILRNNLI